MSKLNWPEVYIYPSTVCNCNYGGFRVC